MFLVLPNGFLFDLHHRYVVPLGYNQFRFDARPELRDQGDSGEEDEHHTGRLGVSQSSVILKKLKFSFI